jgi:ribonuclease-3
MSMQENAVERLEEILGYRFKNKELLRTALTHKTYAFEARTPLEFNERLEFLGDSILNFIIAEQLYRSNRYFSEGELTRRRAICVNNKVLADVAMRLGIGPFLLLGRGEQKQEGAKNRTNLANMLEAIIGALYLDAGLETVRAFILEKIYTKEYQF